MIPISCFSGKATDWNQLDKAFTAKLAEVAAKGGQIRIVSNTILSPTTKKVIADFAAKYPTTQHITYDANPAYGLTHVLNHKRGLRHR